MGEVIAATILYNDGSSIRSDDPQHWEMSEENYRVAFEYDYGPHLLPLQYIPDEGMWRYASLLPIQHKNRLYPLVVGNTPLMGLLGLRRWTGISSLWLKDETRSPTGSNKDRATALVLEQALHRGIQTVSCASTGNVAVSLAVGAAASGMKAMIFVPATISDTKLKIILLAGATVFKVREGYDAAVQLSRIAARTFGWYDRNTGYNPLTLEAKKTVALEIWEQLGHQVPDAVIIPVGDGVTLSGIAKGFRELELCGVTQKRPHLIGVQAMGCQPLKRAWERNEQLHPAQSATIADGIAVDFPINGMMALRDVRESAGAFVSVSDEAIIQAINILALHGSILAEPAGAAAFAGVQEALTSGLIERDQKIVVLVTGTIFKTPQYIQPLSSCSVYQVHANLDEVKHVLQKQCSI